MPFRSTTSPVTRSPCTADGGGGRGRLLSIRGLPGQELVPDHALFGERDDRRTQDAVAVLAPRVEAEGPADPDRATRLMDVPVQTQRWAVTLDHRADCGRAHA